MSPHDFRQQAKAHRKAFKQIWDMVTRDDLAFHKKTIRLDQCDRLYASVHMLNAPAQELSTLFESVSMLPPSVISYRYDILMAVHCVNAVIEELSVLLVSFRRICGTPSRNAMLHLQGIQHRISQLEHSNDIIQQSIDAMLFLLCTEDDGVQTVV